MWAIQRHIIAFQMKNKFCAWAKKQDKRILRIKVQTLELDQKLLLHCFICQVSISRENFLVYLLHGGK